MRKRFLIFFCLVLIVMGCKHSKKTKPSISHQYFESWQLKYVPYKLNDTLSFTNSVNGQIFHYQCTKYDRHMEANGDTTECPADLEFCSVNANEVLDVWLECIENNNYSFRIYYDVGSYYLQFITNSNHHQSLIGTIQKDSSCALSSTVYPAVPPPDVECVGITVVNGKTYSQTAKLIDVRGANAVFDTLYYNKQNGIIRFCSSLGENWQRN